MKKFIAAGVLAVEVGVAAGAMLLGLFAPGVASADAEMGNNELTHMAVCRTLDQKPTTGTVFGIMIAMQKSDMPNPEIGRTLANATVNVCPRHFDLVDSVMKTLP